MHVTLFIEFISCFNRSHMPDTEIGKGVYALTLKKKKTKWVGHFTLFLNTQKKLMLFGKM